MLTKAKLKELGQPVQAVAAELNSAVQSRNVQGIGSGSAHAAAVFNTYAKEIAALKAPSAAAATAQQKYISQIKQGAALFDQLSKAVAAHDQSALKALEQKFATLQAESSTTEAQLDTLLP